uniref:Uncharacterized protein n=1 Tax=Arundo donax TaxID=35708 RepID=A0A0A9CF43_ARUDO
MPYICIFYKSHYNIGAVKD